MVVMIGRQGASKGYQGSAQGNPTRRHVQMRFGGPCYRPLMKSPAEDLTQNTQNDRSQSNNKDEAWLNMGVGCDGRGTFGTRPLPSQPKGGCGKVAVSRLFIRKRAGLFSPARLYNPTSAVGVDTVLYVSQNFTSVRCVIASFKCELLPPLSAKFSDFCACVTSASA